jgi:hypothetical protein
MIQVQTEQAGNLTHRIPLLSALFDKYLICVSEMVRVFAVAHAIEY